MAIPQIKEGNFKHIELVILIGITKQGTFQNNSTSMFLIAFSQICFTKDILLNNLCLSYALIIASDAS